LIVDDDEDITITFKAGIEGINNDANKRIEVYTSNDPVVALSEFKPNFYDLLLVDINMPLWTDLNYLKRYWLSILMSGFVSCLL
jgi:CheY-like chemotaxis protein